MLLFRCRVLLEMTDRVAELHPFHGPLVYALIAEAYGAALGIKSVLPRGLTPLAVEHLRIRLSKGDRYAFGFSLLTASPQGAGEILEAVWRGLEQVGNRRGRRTFEGNFQVAEVTDLFARSTLHLGQAPQPLDPQALLDECRRAQGLSRVTLDFVTPLRWQRPNPLKVAGQHFVDRAVFPPDLLLRRVPERLKTLGLDVSGAPDDLQLEAARLVDNRLVWLDVDYKKARQRRMRLGGAVGRVVLDLPPQYPRHWLVWGQYVHLGESTNFDHGRYRIVELGADPYPCARSASLLQLAMRIPLVEQSALDSSADAASVAAAAQQVKAQRYVPPTPQTILLERIDRGPRRLAVPPAVDRALQRCVLEMISPGLDKLWETSSFAYRRGLSRHAAARAVQKLYAAGYRWALQADFDTFFDSIDRGELRARLHAYLGDAPTEALLLAWIEAGDIDGDGRGLPTGYPISPLLANLFLDQFDEQIEAAGGRLVRYADDFLILFRDQDQAQQMFAEARRAAEALQLQLDDSKTALRDLTEPFHFLGFRFQRLGRWEHHAVHPPQRIEELGWFDLSRHRPPHAPRRSLPGESPADKLPLAPICIIDSGVNWLGAEQRRLVLARGDGARFHGPQLDEVEQILVVGPATLDESLLRHLAAEPVPIIVCHEDGRPMFEWLPEEAGIGAELVQAQVSAAADEARRLILARALVAAKLHNYAALADAYSHSQEQPPLGCRLRQLRDQAEQAQRIEELLGYEGAAAALWYGHIHHRLPSRFSFPGRRSPHADDPINVMLNIAQTHLYRQCRVAARLCGLIPTIGILHRPQPGFAALAADLQEPFRFLMDRAVMETAFEVQHRDFAAGTGGPYPLTMSWQARRKLLAALYETMQLSACREGTQDPTSYRGHLLRLARSVRRWLGGDDDQLVVFRTPAADAQP
jgi:CRISPR-associated endonuclease Cas1